MKQILVKNNEIVLANVPAPFCSKNSIIVRNAYSLISTGTEITSLAASGTAKKSIINPALIKKAIKKMATDGPAAVFDKVREKLETYASLGYSSAGIVLEVGSHVSGFQEGDRVACAGAGLANHSEIVCVPGNLTVKLEHNMSLNEAAFTTLGSIALQGVRQARPMLGENVAVIGLGLIGLLTVQLLKATGCTVIGVDINDNRIKKGDDLGIDMGLNPFNPKIVEEIYQYTAGIGVDSVIITASTPTDDPVKLSMGICRKKGKIVVVGDVGMNISRSPFYEKELDFTISCSYGPGRYDPLYEEKGIDYPAGYVRWTENRNMKSFAKMVAEKKVDVKSLVTSSFPIEKAADAYKYIQNNRENVFAIILKYPSADPTKPISHKLQLVKKPKDKNVINVAVIGCGGFATTVHLPNLLKIDGYNIKALVGRKGVKLKQLAKQFKSEYCSTDIDDVLNDSSIDTVFITTRHDLHSLITIKAAKAGKDIFVEKPMAITLRECDDIKRTIQKAGINYTVGFNRRYASLSVKAKEYLINKKGPLFINYRVNAGHIPRDNWVHNPEEGGGRIIGECCHFFDLFNFFIGSSPAEIYGKCLPANNVNVVAEDNAVITIKYNNGSIAVLTYVAIGDHALSKERIEIFADQSSIVIDDFKLMDLYGYEEKNISLPAQDKGHYNQLVEFLKKIKGQESNLLSIEDGIKATICSLKAVESIKTGKNIKINWKRFLL